MESWPPSLKAYVEDVFRYSSPELLDVVQNELRKLIMEKHNEGTLLTTDWSEMDLPSSCEAPANRKSKKKASSINNRKKTTLSIVETTEEEQKRKNRLRRFQESNNLAKQRSSPSVQLPPPAAIDEMDWDRHIVIGTATNLEKNYLRLTSAPDPSTVRPLPVLKKTLELLKSKWTQERNYTYICDQFKSLRQDLTVQHIKNEFTVQVYEIHARIALEKADLGEFNQNQTQLKYLYAQGIPGHVEEFTAYRLLYFLHTQNWADINSVMASITEKQKQCAAIKHALDVRSALATSNYHRLFKLYVTAPNMGGYLMDQFIVRERVQAMIILCKAYRPNLALSFIMKELAFENSSQMEKFIKEEALIPAAQLTSGFLDTKLATAGLTESMKKYKKIDIKGQL
ncbi:SAC3/GANP/Nin1/mts3/eIF-3 p25 family-domain-containing protein [Halteromyces radiatus]|uniref:SAC3/GANP/Nin1/mts3/eIF-3 p25 family-domain-containing protein n=1 Tax=Halteromyces radiatus TaxID=101107 RepID=UPI00221F1503|nr:SAC3/GANP/Nin1/mts3/eIF-3 p25 family-domain-containing protein [Halteromyces radiatus]KAI8099329.1 SAC3/GANP/Nin1/mts3/eIF-3 p25 family-domain-containing protein [Halteromyces radiatus]